MTAVCSEGQRQDKLVALGRVGRPYGTRGWLRLQSYTEPPANLLNYTEFHVRADGKQRILEMDECQSRGNGLLAHFVACDSPEAARGLAGLTLSVPAGALPPLAAGEYYRHQLVGLRVVNTRGVDFGIVGEVLETGANDVLVMAPDASSCDGRKRLIPYLPGKTVRSVNLPSGVMTVDWEADYLLD